MLLTEHPLYMAVAAFLKILVCVQLHYWYVELHTYQHINTQIHHITLSKGHVTELYLN